jgi:S-formylglutathione hydrolase FrmB
VAAIVLVAIAIRELVLDADTAPSETRGAKVTEYSVDSELLGEELPVNVVVPPGAMEGKRSLLVFLHGRGEDESSYLDEEMVAALARLGGKAPVVAFPRGGSTSYWHDRDSGAWGSYVLDELVPRIVKRFDIEPERIAIGGISMGGFGAVDIARQGPLELGGGKEAEFCAVGAHSPAVWQQGSDTAPGAFDDGADFSEHDVIGLVGPPSSPLDGTRFWVDVGDQDPFAEAAEKLASELEAGGAEGDFVLGEGEHEDSYWSGNWRRYMRFYGRALNACRLEAKAERQAAKQASKGSGGGSGNGPEASSGGGG